MLTGAILAERYPLLRWLAYRLTQDHAAVDDLVQETMMLAWNGRKRFNGAHLNAWLTTIMRHALASFKRRKRLDTMSINEFIDVESEALMPASLVWPPPQDQSILAQEIYAGVDGRRRTVLDCLALGLSERETATKIGATLLASKRLTHRVRHHVLETIG